MSSQQQYLYDNISSQNQYCHNSKIFTITVYLKQQCLYNNKKGIGTSVLEELSFSGVCIVIVIGNRMHINRQHFQLSAALAAAYNICDTSTPVGG